MVRRRPSPVAALAAALFACSALLAPSLACASERHPYDDLADHDRPNVYGEMAIGWRSATTRLVGLAEPRPDAWGVLFGLRADVYSGRTDKLSGRSTIDLAGGGGHFADWRASFDFTIGKRVELGGSSGLAVRGGLHAHSVGTYGSEARVNARARDARIDLPVLELAYQRTHGLGLLELGVRGSLSLYGYFAPGDDGRSWTLKPGLGAYVAYHHDDVHLELEATEASIARRPVAFVNGLLCTTASYFALCGDLRYVAGAVDDAGARTLASWHLGVSVGAGYDLATKK